MPYKITYPMELEGYIRSIEEESGMERDETTVKLAAAVATRINKAYYRGKHGREIPQHLKGGDPLQDEFLRMLHLNEQAAYYVGRRDRWRIEKNKGNIAQKKEN